MKAGVVPALKAAALVVPVLLLTNLPLGLFGIDITENDAAIHNNRGIIYYDRGTYNLAIEEFEHAIRIQPEHPKLHSNLGLAYLSQGYSVAASLEFEEALRLYPNEPKALVNLGGIYLERYLGGEDEYAERALQYLTQAVTVVPGSTPAQINLAILRLSGEDYIGAALVLEKALKFRPDNPDLLFMLGHLFARELNNPERAVPLLERFLETRPWTERHNVALDWLEYLG
jgi:tetratricopeptide (TPR) repeat protein